MIPLDGSARAEQTLGHAIAQAGRFQSELILLDTIEPFPNASSMSLADLQQQRQQMHIWGYEIGSASRLSSSDKLSWFSSSQPVGVLTRGIQSMPKPTRWI